ncbi:MAG: DUF5674 family protein [Candidatus Saccharimonadales bacterium]
MKQVDKISVNELQEMAEKMFGELVKADVDVARRVMVVDMPMHYEGEAYLLENGSTQKDLWGINLHPADFGADDFIEFDSMINIRPSGGNPSKDVLDPKIRAKIIEIVSEIVHD